MNQPVEIDQKKTKLVLTVVFSLAFVGLLFFKIMIDMKKEGFTTETVFLDALPIIFIALFSFIAIMNLVQSFSRRDPFLLVFDDHIETYTTFLSKKKLVWFDDFDKVCDEVVNKRHYACFKTEMTDEKAQNSLWSKLKHKLFSKQEMVPLDWLELSREKTFDIIEQKFLDHQLRNDRLPRRFKQ